MGKVLISESNLTDIADSIRTKLGTSVTYTPSEMSAAIDDIPTGGEAVEADYKPVEFIDYDGFRLYSYTKEEFLELTEMPPLTSHKGLISQGWNWTLEDAQDYVRKYGVHVIGQTYITDDGKTRLYIHVYHTPETATIYLQTDSSRSFEFDWGDGTIETIAGTVSTVEHTYTSVGDYVIAIEVLSGKLTFSTSNNVRSFMLPKYLITKIEFGADVNSVAYMASYFTNLRTVTIPYGLNPSHKVSDGTSLRAVVIPKGSGIPTYAFVNAGIEIVSLPKSTNNLTASFSGPSTLRRVIIPEGVTRIDSNGPRILASVREMRIPDTVTYMYQNVFNSMSSCVEYHFYSATPPTRGGSSAFSGMPADCVIYVPYSEDHSILEEYKTSTNWASMAGYMQEEPSNS